MSYRARRAKLSCIVAIVAVSVLLPANLWAFKAGAHAVLTNEIAHALPEGSIFGQAILEFPNIAAWGSTGPDIPANSWGILYDEAPWFELYHYEKVGSFAAELLRLALRSGERRNYAWAAGWLSHVIGDLHCHGIYVNPDPEVDGVYLDDPDTKDNHGLLEAWADKLLYTDRSNPKRPYTAQNMQATFRSFDSDAVRDLMIEASRNVYDKAPSHEDFIDWMDFFKDVYLDTGVAGGTNWVYDNEYSEVLGHLTLGVLSSGPYANMSRRERLELACDETVRMTAALLQQAERNVYDGLSDAWNLDAYHRDGRSIGTLTVEIRTADVSMAGTDDDVYFGLIRDDGEQWLSPVLDKGSGLLGLGTAICNDFERGSVQTYYLFVDRHDFPIDRIAKVFLQKDDDFVGGGWKVGSMTVTINGATYFDGRIDTWLQDDRLRWEGAVMDAAPRRIPVNMEVQADAASDRVNVTATHSGGRGRYSGAALLYIQHADDSVETHQITIGSDGTFARSLPLRPDDLLQVNVYRPQENDSTTVYVGSSVLKHPTVPFSSIEFTADVFNDRVSGTVSGNYSGPIELLLDDDYDHAEQTVKSATATNGTFSIPVALTGADMVSVRVQYEGVAFPRSPIYVYPGLDALAIACSQSANDTLTGTVTNSVVSGPSYQGDVTLWALEGSQAVSVTRAAAAPSSPFVRESKATVTKLPSSQKTSSFVFDHVPIVLALGYEVVIEHEGARKSFVSDPLGDVAEQANQPLQEAVTSPVAAKFDQVVNPAMRTGVSDARVSNAAQSQHQQASYVQSMPVAPQSPVWNGVWESTAGSMLLTQTGPKVQGTYGYDDYRLEGTANGDKLVGTFIEEDGSTGEFSLSLYAMGRRFDGVMRYLGDDGYSQWDGTLVARLEEMRVEPASNGLEGVWFSDRGAIVLDGQGTFYNGCFGEYGGTLQGDYRNNSLEGTWQEDGLQGTFRLWFNTERNSFEGTIFNAEDGSEDEWNGLRKL